jgi:MFS transporter, APGE family, 1-arseno-3-phosphoglycerate exporter
MSDLRSYALVTAAYWGFTLTDGALRMLVLLHFNTLGYSPLQIATLFLLYEFFGIVTNLGGGWLSARFGLRSTLLLGLAVQVAALAMLAQVAPQWVLWLSVAYVMAAQALSGIAKDLTKMSAKSAIKLVLPEGADSALFRWVALLTGSKNALKGAGFFLGGLLLGALGFAAALLAMAAALALLLLGVWLALPREMGRVRGKVPFTQVFSQSRFVNVLSAARFFLFGARDVWFVVGLPIFLYDTLGWGFADVGGFLALWVIAYGAIQAAAPALFGEKGLSPSGRTAPGAAFVLAAVPATIAALLRAGVPAAPVIVGGLALFAAVLGVNSALHSFLIVQQSDRERVTLDVGFYYMANAGGRLAGTVLSGGLFQWAGLPGCLWAAAALAVLAGLVSLALPGPVARAPVPAGG